MADLSTAAGLHAIFVQGPVYLGGGQVSAEGLPKGQPVGAAALGTRAMPGSERHCFIEEKQLGIATGVHNGPMTAFEGQLAADPSLVAPARCAKTPITVMKDAAIAHQRSATGIGNDLSGRENAVLAWGAQTIISLVADRVMSG